MRGDYTAVDSPPSPGREGRKSNNDKGGKDEDYYIGNSRGCFYCESFNGYHRTRHLVLKLLFVVFIGLIVLYSLDAFYPGGSFVGSQILGLSETRLVPISTVWQSSVFAGEVEVQDHTTPEKKGGDYVHMFKFLTLPELSVVEEWDYRSNSKSISTGNFTYWSRYFYSGSSVTVSYNFSKPITVYIFAGQHSLQIFEKEAGPRRNELIKDAYKETHARNTFYFDFSEDDVYWIIFYNNKQGHSDTVEGYYHMNITNMLYNTTEKVDSCVLPCSLSVSYKSTEVLILHTPPLKSFVEAGNGTSDAGFVFTIHENRRNNITMAYFFIPLGALVLACVFIVVWDLSKMYACGFVWPLTSVRPRTGPSYDLITNYTKHDL